MSPYEAIGIHAPPRVWYFVTLEDVSYWEIVCWGWADPARNHLHSALERPVIDRPP